MSCLSCNCTSSADVVSCEQGLVCRNCGLVLREPGPQDDQEPDAGMASCGQGGGQDGGGGESLKMTAAEYQCASRFGKDHSLGLYSSLPRHLRTTGGKLLRQGKQFRSRRLAELKRAAFNIGTQLHFTGTMVAQACSCLEQLLDDIAKKQFLFARKQGYLKLVCSCLLHVARQEGARFAMPMSEMATYASCSVKEFFASHKKVVQHLAARSGGAAPATEDPQAGPSSSCSDFSLQPSAERRVGPVRHIVERTLSEFCAKVASLDLPGKNHQQQQQTYVRELLELSTKIYDFASAKLHIERYARKPGQMTSMIVYVAWSVLALKWSTAGRRLLKPIGATLTSPLLFHDFLKHYALETGTQCYKCLHELTICFVRESAELPWILQRTNANTIHKYIPGILANYVLNPITSNAISLPVRRTHLRSQRQQSVEVNAHPLQDVHSEQLTEYDLSESEFGQYLRTEREVAELENLLESST